MKNLVVFLLFFTFFSKNTLFAQTKEYLYSIKIHQKEVLDSIQDHEDAQMDTKDQIILQLGYMNNVNYRARNYGYNGFTPQITYKFNFGLSLYASANYWGSFSNNVTTATTVKRTTPRRHLGVVKYDTTTTTYQAMTKHLTQTSLGISYEKMLFNDKLYFGISYEHWFLRNGTNAEKNAMNNFLALDLSYNFFDFLNLNASTYYMFGNQKSYQINLGFSKDFEFRRVLGARKIVFSPAVVAMLGNENVFPFSKNFNYANSQEENFFGIMGYNFSLPIAYQTKYFEITPSFNYSLPMNTNADESSQNFFYFNMNLTYKIPQK